MIKTQQNKAQGIVGTLIVHGLLFVLLWLLVLRTPPKIEESGLPVELGNVELSSGTDYDLTEVEVAQNEPVEPAITQPSTPTIDEPLLTQEVEETVEIPSSENTIIDEQTEEQIEAEKRAEAERIAREADKKIAGAFGKGNQMSNRGAATESNGVEGSQKGNSTVGTTSGVGGYGTFDLSGRSLGRDGLPRPVYNIQDEGRVVVTITVSPSGNVIATSINSRTNTVNPTLRKAALEAAAKAQFNSVDVVDNQMGTITYYFKLR